MTLRTKAAVLHILIGGALLSMTLVCAPSASAQNTAVAATGPFGPLSGAWSGRGTVDTREGAHEHVRCKATYEAKDAGQAVRLDLVCASDAYKFTLNGNIVQRGEALSGNWFESTRRVGGSLNGRNKGGLIEARAEGDTFTALLTVKTTGGRQIFLMESPGSRFEQVKIELSRN